MASLLFNKTDKMKQRLHKSFSCSSAASTSVIAFSSGRAIDRHSPHLRRRLTEPTSVPKPNNGSSSSSTKMMMMKKKTTTSPASSSRFLLNSSRLQLEQSADDADLTVLDSMPPPSFINFFPVTTSK